MGAPRRGSPRACVRRSCSVATSVFACDWSRLRDHGDHGLHFGAEAALASFCRETPAFVVRRVSSPIKLGPTDGGCRRSPDILTRFSWRFHEASVRRDGGCNDLAAVFPPQTKHRKGILSGGFSSAQ